MCLALPARIEASQDDMAWVRLGDARMRVSLIMTPDARVGDWVLVHAGFAIQQVSDEDARETWSMVEESGLREADRPLSGAGIDAGIGIGTGAADAKKISGEAKKQEASR
jgi:hydrogenase expression/formation protein HypC